MTKKTYGENFKGFAFNSLEDILPSKDKYLDHICECIMDKKNKILKIGLIPLKNSSDSIYASNNSKICCENHKIVKQLSKHQKLLFLH